MSFSSETKSAVAKLNPQNDCCARAQLYAMLVFGAAVSDKQAVFCTENEDTAYIFSGLLLRCFDIISSPVESLLGKTGNTLFKTVVCDENGETLKKFVSSFDRQSRAIRCSHCFEAFLRGAFLSCGFVNPPDKSYGIEFSLTMSRYTTTS